MKLSAIIIIILISSSVFSQIPNNDFKKNRKEQSIEQINELRNGVLLVRLKTKENTISALKERGLDNKAKQIENELYETNKAIMDAFKSNFDFCKFYFFSSKYSVFLKNKQFDSVFYYNSELVIDKNIRPLITKFYVAEYAPIESDTSSYYKSTKPIRGENGIEKKDNYYKQGTYGFEALIIRSDGFVQLAKPFPYYVRTWDSWIKPKKVVKKMNKKLKKYYEKVNH